MHLRKQNAGVYSSFVSFHHSVTLDEHALFPKQQLLFILLDRKLVLIYVYCHISSLSPYQKEKVKIEISVKNYK